MLLGYYIKTAFRNLIKHKYHTFLNVFGLALALFLVVLIALYSHKELSTNKFHNNAENIYKVSGWGTPMALAPFLEKRIPEIEAITRTAGGMYYSRNIILDSNEKLEVKGIVLCDNSFFDVFTFPIIQGEQNEPLINPYAIVLTESLAQKVFGHTNAVGKKIKLEGEELFTVTAIMKDPPHNSSLHFSALISAETWVKITHGSINDNWDNFTYETFARFNSNANIPDLQQKIQSTITAEGNLQYEVEHVKLYSLEEVYFNKRLQSHFKRGDKELVNAIIIIGILILFLAIINFFNLSTARGIARSKEIGIRKVNGGNRRLLIYQFFSESILVALFSMVIALAFINMFLPQFNNLTQSQFDYFHLQTVNQWLIFIGGSIAVGLLAGSYPALYLSSFKPVDVMKVTKIKTKGVATFRKSLTVFQFAVSIALIIGTITVSKQVNYLQNKDLGFNKDDLLCFMMNRSIYSKQQVLQEKLNSNPAFSSYSKTYGVIGNTDAGGKLKTLYRGEEKEIWCKFLIVDSTFLNTFDIKLLQGRNFKAGEEGVIILNQAALKKLDVENPLDLEVLVSFLDHEKVYEKVVGVVKDFNFMPLNHGIEPLAIRYIPQQTYMYNLRFNPKSFNSVNEILTNLKATLGEISPDEEVQTFFLNDHLANIYQKEKFMRRMFMACAIFAIIISCLGLLGMIIFSNARRIKEIGVRKVLGAEISSILLLLIKNYVKWVAIAFVIAAPLAYYLLSQWLTKYPFRTNLSWWIFTVGGLMTLIIAVSTVVLQSYRAASQNPVKSLRYE